MYYFRSVKKSKSYKANLRKKVLSRISCESEVIQDSTDESGDDKSQYSPSSESELDDREQEGVDPNNVASITDCLVNEGLYKFATSISGGSKSEAAAMLWVKRTAQILDYTYYEVNKRFMFTNGINEDITLR